MSDSYPDELNLTKLLSNIRKKRLEFINKLSQNFSEIDKKLIIELNSTPTSSLLPKRAKRVTKLTPKKKNNYVEEITPIQNCKKMNETPQKLRRSARLNSSLQSNLENLKRPVLDAEKEKSEHISRVKRLKN